jgi:hypothetical protein
METEEIAGNHDFLRRLRDESGNVATEPTPTI